LQVTSAKWSFDGTRILTTSDDQTARVWNAIDGTQLFQLAHSGVLQDAFWNDDASRILTYDGKTAHIWDAETGAELRTLRHEDILRGAGWRKDGSQVLTWSWDKTMRLWDATLGTELTRLKNDGVGLVATNQDETRMLTLSDDHSIRIWSTVDRTTLPSMAYAQAAWNPTQPQQLLLWSPGDTTVHIWDETTQQDAMVLEPSGTLQSVRWNEAGTQVLISTDVGTIEIWDAATGSLQFTIPIGDASAGAAWNAAGTAIIVWNGQSCQIWDTATGQVTDTLAVEGEIVGGEWNPDDSHILIANADNKFWTWNATARTLSVPYVMGDDFSSAWLNYDGSQLLVLSNSEKAQVLDTTTGEVVHDLTISGTFRGIDWSPDGTKAAIFEETSIQIWDVQSWTLKFTLQHEDFITSGFWNSDGTHLVSTSRDRTARIWDTATGAELALFRHEDWVASAAWNKDETQLLTWGYDKKLRLWDIATGEELLRLPHDDTVYEASWNADETRLISRADKIQVWFVNLDDYLKFSQAFLIRDFAPEDRGRFFLPTATPMPTLDPSMTGLPPRLPPGINPPPTQVPGS
jgi:WD40 repeat protein